MQSLSSILRLCRDQPSLCHSFSLTHRLIPAKTFIQDHLKEGPAPQAYAQRPRDSQNCALWPLHTELGFSRVKAATQGGTTHSPSSPAPRRPQCGCHQAAEQVSRSERDKMDPRWSGHVGTCCSQSQLLWSPARLSTHTEKVGKGL